MILLRVCREQLAAGYEGDILDQDASASDEVTG